VTEIATLFVWRSNQAARRSVFGTLLHLSAQQNSVKTLKEEKARLPYFSAIRGVERCGKVVFEREHLLYRRARSWCCF
jgi:hypothetical protein